MSIINYIGMAVGGLISTLCSVTLFRGKYDNPWPVAILGIVGLLAAALFALFEFNIWGVLF